MNFPAWISRDLTIVYLPSPLPDQPERVYSHPADPADRTAPGAWQYYDLLPADALPLGTYNDWLNSGGMTVFSGGGSGGTVINGLLNTTETVALPPKPTVERRNGALWFDDRFFYGDDVTDEKIREDMTEILERYQRAAVALETRAAERKQKADDRIKRVVDDVNTTAWTPRSEVKRIVKILDEKGHLK